MNEVSFLLEPRDKQDEVTDDRRPSRWEEGWLQAAYTVVVCKCEPIQNHLRGSTLFLVKLVYGGT